MKLIPFHIQINRQPPFIGLFASSFAAWETFCDRAFTEAHRIGGFKISVRRMK
jgi:hypothetical protein